MTLPRERFEESPIVRRPVRPMPNGARIAVWTIVNVEDWDITGPMPRQVLPAPQGAATLPDVPNWAWHEYGLRVGFWRLFDALRSRDIRATTSINAKVCNTYPSVAGAMRDANWEFMAHGLHQRAMHTLEDQRGDVREAARIIREFTGKPSRGWLGPGLTETWDTPEILKGEGFDYVADWVNDDLPYTIETAAGPLVSVPYSVELNDLPMMVLQHRPSAEWLIRCRDTFDRLYAEGADRPRVMAMAVHPYVSGVPHRIAAFEAVYDYIAQHNDVWMATGDEICDWYLGASS